MVVSSIIIIGGWVYVSDAPRCSSRDSWGLSISFHVQKVNLNWTLWIRSVTCGLYLTSITMTILNGLIEPVGIMNHVPLSELTPANWDTYKVVYQKYEDESTLAIGAKILFDATAYPAGYTVAFYFSGNNEFARHTFR